MFRITNKLRVSVFIVLFLSVALFTLAPSVTNAQRYVEQPQQDNSEQYRTFLFQKLLQLQAQLEVLLELQAQLNLASQSVGVTPRAQPNPYFIQASTLAPLSVERTVAELQGKIDKGSSDSIDVWFQYGIGRSLNKKSQTENIESTRNSAYSEKVFNLESDTRYSYRIIVEDQKGNRQYGEIRTFVTPAGATTVSFTGQPLVEIEGVTNIRSSSAELKGFVSMNDYDEGKLFFVYGTDLGDIKEVEEEDSYEDIIVARGGGVQKRMVDETFSGRDIVSLRVSGLTRATKNYYSVCVDYSRGIRCSDVGSFVTPNN